MKKIILICLVFLSFANAKSILFLGDSLTEGYGLSKEESYPTLVGELIQKELNKDVEIINGGVSGSTTNDAIARLKWYLRKKPDIVFVALGANDGLRGYGLSKSQQNLEKIITMAKDSGAKVLLAGMLLPPNYGDEYSKAFKQMYLDVKKKYDLRMLPFLLDSVAGDMEYNQKDGIHPNAEGYKLIARDVFEFLKKEL